MNFEPVQAANLDWRIWRPILRNPPLCTLRELTEGPYTIDELADMHEAMDVEDENARRHEAAQEKKH